MMQRRKPICAASRTRSPACVMPRTSPASPTSPNIAVVGGNDAVADARRDRGERRRGRTPARRPSSRRRCSRTHRRRPGSGRRASRAPPAAATAAADRCRSPSAARCRRCCVLTSACTSTRIGREPSTEHSTAEPGAFAGRSARNSFDGLGTGRRPVDVISNTPSSLTAPNRFFTARTTRCEWCRSPSK